MHFNIHIKTLTNLKKMNKLLMFDLFYIKSNITLLFFFFFGSRNQKKMIFFV